MTFKDCNLVCWSSISFGFNFEARLGAPDGKLIGKGSMPTPKKGQPMGMAHVSLDAVADGQFHTIYFKYKPINPKGVAQAGITGLQFGTK